MRQGLIVFILLIVTDVMGQTSLNTHRRLTKDEFIELKRSRDQFLPTDIKDDTVVIVKYSPFRLGQLCAMARNTEFASNGEDTIGYSDEKLFGAKQAERGRRVNKRMSENFPVDQAKALKKKGVMSVIVDEVTLLTSKKCEDKYWLTTVFLCDQDGFKGPWVITVTNRIYDPRMGKHFEIFLPSNFQLTDLLD